jgi:hypothetical protein
VVGSWLLAWLDGQVLVWRADSCEWSQKMVSGWAL